MVFREESYAPEAAGSARKSAAHITSLAKIYSTSASA
jgi:hypothetical protein